MSQIKLRKATRKRIPRIIDGLLSNKTHEEIAKGLGIKNRKTIERDLKAWRLSGGMETFLQNEWLRLHGKVKEMDPVEAHRQLTKLLGKTMAQKIEAQIAQKEPFIIKMWKPDQDAETQE